MESAPQFADVIDGLGEKVVAALWHAVAAARSDLAAYREAFPGWVADATERGLANWIHDRLWSHLLRSLDDVADVQVDPGEPTREIVVGIRYRLRVKRHDDAGHVAAIETQTMLEFFAQGVQPTFPSMEELRLFAGYVWDKETRVMGSAVLSLRDGRDNIIWQEELPDLGGDVAAPAPLPPRDGPRLPDVAVDAAGDEEQDLG